MKSAAQALTGSGNYGFIFPAGKNRITSIFVSSLICSAGGTYFNKDFNVAFDNPGTVKALTFLKEMAACFAGGVKFVKANRLRHCLAHGGRQEHRGGLGQEGGEQAGRPRGAQWPEGAA